MNVRDDHGSSVATVVILTPIFVLMLFFVVYAGRLAVARQAAGAVARDAARSAAVGLDPAPADGHQAMCAGGMHVSVTGADPGRGDQVTATATCAVDGGQLMASLGVGLTTVEAQATAWVDVYRSGS